MEYMKVVEMLIKRLKHSKNYGKFRDLSAEKIRWFNFIHIDNEN